MKQRVLQAFAEQAHFCTELGSPLTGQLCLAFSQSLDEATKVGAALANLSDRFAKNDLVPIRVMGALHALARDGHHPELAAYYPPNPVADTGALWGAIAPLLDSEHAHFERYLQQVPQTNEVGRSALLMAGLLEVANYTRTPLRLFEIGASAGLNLILDRYRYRFGDAVWGDANAKLCLQPTWIGESPPVAARLEVLERFGADINPLNLGDRQERARVLSYIWADQLDRFTRIEAAIETALLDLPCIERMDAADWLEARMNVHGDAGVTQVLMHSVVWQYLADATRARIEAHMLACAAKASMQRPLAWVRFELNEGSSDAVLSVTVWPEGQSRELATAHAHGSSVKYLAHL